MTHAVIYTENCYQMTVTTPGYAGEPKFSIPEYPEDALARCTIGRSNNIEIVLIDGIGSMSPDEAQTLTEEIEEAQEHAAELQRCIEAAREIITDGAQRITGYDVHITTGNAEMCEPEHVAAALRHLARTIENGTTACSISDQNGNTVGELTTTAEDNLKEALEALQDRDW